jgi:hypothetical protein
VRCVGRGLGTVVFVRVGMSGRGGTMVGCATARFLPITSPA